MRGRCPTKTSRSRRNRFGILASAPPASGRVTFTTLGEIRNEAARLSSAHIVSDLAGVRRCNQGYHEENLEPSSYCMQGKESEIRSGPPPPEGIHGIVKHGRIRSSSNPERAGFGESFRSQTLSIVHFNAEREHQTANRFHRQENNSSNTTSGSESVEYHPPPASRRRHRDYCVPTLHPPSLSSSEILLFREIPCRQGRRLRETRTSASGAVNGGSTIGWPTARRSWSSETLTGALTSPNTTTGPKSDDRNLKELDLSRSTDGRTPEY